MAVAFTKTNGLGVFWPFGAPSITGSAYDTNPFLQPSSFSTHIPAAVLANIVRHGFDHIRLHVVPGPWMEAYDTLSGAPETARLNVLSGHLDTAINAIIAAGLGVVLNMYPVDFQTLYKQTNILAGGTGGALFTTYKLVVNHFATRYAAKAVTDFALEFWNEPLDPADISGTWETYQTQMYTGARAIMPNHTFILTGANFGDVENLILVNASLYNANVMYSVHAYFPQLLAHQGYPDNGYNKWITGLIYPPNPLHKIKVQADMETAVNADGTLTAPQKLATIAMLTADIDFYFDVPLDASWVDDFYFNQVGDWLSSNGLVAANIYVGEFGSTRTNSNYNAADHTTRVAYINDIRSKIEGRGYAKSWFAIDTYDYGMTTGTDSGIGDFLLDLLDFNPYTPVREQAFVLRMRPFDEASSSVIEDGPLPYGMIDFPDEAEFAVTGGIVDYYVATHEFTTMPSDILPRTNFRGGLTSALNFSVSLFEGIEPKGAGRPGFGEVRFADPSGFFDLIIPLAFDGRDLELYRGKPDEPFSTYVKVASMTSAGMLFNMRDKWFLQRDRQEILYSTQLLVSAFGGGGGYDGDATLAGRLRPQAYGHVFNVKPILTDSPNRIFQWHDGQVQAVTALREGASAYTFVGPDCADDDALVAIVLTPGQYATCNALAMIRLGGDPVYDIRIDGQGDNIDGFVETRADIVQRIATYHGIMPLEDSQMDFTSFIRLNELQPEPIGIYIDGAASIGQVLDTLMAGILGWWCIGLDGRMFVGQLDEPADEPDFILDYEKGDIIDDPQMTTWQTPRYITRVGHQHNWHPQSTTELGTGATVAEQRLYSEEWQFSESIQQGVTNAYPTAKSVFAPAFYRDLVGSAAEALRQRALMGVRRERWTVTANIDPFSPMLGRTVEIRNFPRYNFGDARRFRVVGMSTSTQRTSVTLELWAGIAIGYVAPEVPAIPVNEGAAAITLGGITLVATAVHAGAHTGTSSITLGGVTLAATGKAAVKGTSSITMGGVTLAATGTAAVKGTSSITLGGVTLAATTSNNHVGSASITMGGVTLAATGTAAVKGTSSITVGAVTLSATGTVTVKGTSSVTLGAVTLSATGTAASDDGILTLGGESLTLGGESLTLGAAAYTPSLDFSDARNSMYLGVV